MDIAGWLLWGVLKVVGLVWSFVWFLLGGWVSTLVQLLVIVGIVFAMKYGWRRAPEEFWRRLRTFGGFAWGWARSREAIGGPAGAESRVREVVRHVPVMRPGDVNLSTVLSVVMLAGMMLAVAL